MMPAVSDTSSWGTQVVAVKRRATGAALDRLGHQSLRDGDVDVQRQPSAA